MTVIKPNSIAGIVSVTAQGDTINFYKSDGTLAGLEIGGARINTAGVGTFSVGPVFIGSATSTGTASQPLQVTGGAYISGNLGIGTTNPSTKLVVTQASAATCARFETDDSQVNIRFSDSTTTNQVGVGAIGNDFIVTMATGGERLRVTSSGSVGIGTTNPQAKLNIVGNAVGNIVGLGTTNATTTLDLSTGNNLSLTLVGNITIANPTNIVPGQSGFISIVQDSQGSRTVGWGSYWDFPNSTPPTLTTTANGVDIVAYYVRTTTSIACDTIIGIGTL